MRRGFKVGAVVAVLAFVLANVSSGSSGASGASADPQATIAANVVYIIQGETELVPGHESSRDFYVLHIMTYDLPYNATRVYSSVPRDARNITVMNINDTSSGWQEPAPSKLFYVDVPSSVPRDALHRLTLDNASAFQDGGTFTDVSFSSGSLHLDLGASTGVYVSGDHRIPNCHSAVSGNISLEGTYLANVSGEVSNDGGASWVSAVPGSNFTFASEGAVLKVRLSFTGNATISPNVTAVSVNARYTLSITPFTVHISYLWSPVFLDGVARFDLGEPFDYSQNGSIILMAYLVRGYIASAQGLNLRFDEGGSMSAYPDKDLYLNMTVLKSQNPSISIDVTAPKSNSSGIWYIGGAAAAVLLIAAFAVFSRSHRRPRKASAPLANDGNAVIDSEARDPSTAVRRQELVARKKALLGQMEEIKGKGPQGKPAKGDRAGELARLHKEYKSVRNELNRLSRVPNATSSIAEAAGGSDALRTDYESSLAVITRLDEDFEARRLPEGAYRSMRKDYLARAARLKAETELPGIIAEKNKLMEAIATLDEEHERGAMDEKVYKDLRASYARELAEVMRRAEGEEADR